METAKATLARSGWIVISRATIAATVVHRPVRTIVRTENRVESREPMAEARSMVMDTGSILTPVSRASSPRTSCR